jgi:RimJ/RimL family protein N-acetyltransferase
MTLEGTSVRLRALTSADSATLRGYINDPEVLQFSNAYRPISDVQQDAWWKAVMSDPNVYWFGIETVAESIDSRPQRSKDENHPTATVPPVGTIESKLVGSCCLVEVDWIARQAELRIRIGDKAAWGKSLGREACGLLVEYGFQHLNLERIWLRVLARNTRALALYERIGFVREGQLRRAWRMGGVTDDLIVMGLLRDEWLANQPQSR